MLGHLELKKGICQPYSVKIRFFIDPTIVEAVTINSASAFAAWLREMRVDDRMDPQATEEWNAIYTGMQQGNLSYPIEMDRLDHFYFTLTIIGVE